MPLVGGAEIAVKEITDRLDGDFSFDLICARIKSGLLKEEKLGRVKVYRVGWGLGKIDKLLLPWRGARLAQKLHEHNKYDAAWAVMASFGGLAALFFKNSAPRVPYLLNLQEGDTPEHIQSRARWLGPYFKKIFTQADIITALSQYLADWARGLGVKAPIEIIPNGVDIEKFKIQFASRRIKDKLNITDADKVIITVSRLVEKNGLGDLIKAMSYLPENVKLLVIGSGQLETDLKRKITDLKLDNRVIMLGAINNQAIPEYLSLADVFVRPSLAEGLGISFLEAMAAGVPVVATPVGGITDFLRDGETGLFCKVHNPESIAEKVKIYLTNPALSEKIKINAKELVKKNYDWDLIAEKMEAVFNKITCHCNGII